MKKSFQIQYTDYNITSSKIITADNITTMRSDLNLVTNTVDVVSYDVKDLQNKVDVLDSDMAETKQKTKYLEKEVDKIDMKANVGIALGVAGCVLAATGISNYSNVQKNMYIYLFYN